MKQKNLFNGDTPITRWLVRWGFKPLGKMNGMPFFSKKNGDIQLFIKSNIPVRYCDFDMKEKHIPNAYLCWQYDSKHLRIKSSKRNPVIKFARYNRPFTSLLMGKGERVDLQFAKKRLYQYEGLIKTPVYDANFY